VASGEMFTDNYFFFGKSYRISTDSKAFRQELKDIYRHFLSLKRGEIFEKIHIFSGQTNCQKAGIKWDDSFYPLSKLSARQVALAIPSLIASRMSSHFIFHGGVVSWKGKGFIICAYSAFGKTTLVMELLKRGFSLLSDELAPISVSSRLIEPFPRSLRLSAKTFKLFPELSTAHLKKNKKDRRRKIMLDIDNLAWAKLGERCFPGYVIFLSPPGGIKGKETFIELALTYITPAFLKKLAKIKGVREVSRIKGRDFSLLSLKVKKGVRLIPAIKNLCLDCRIPLIYAHRGKAGPMDWQAFPSLKPIASSSGFLKLSQMLLLVSKEALLKGRFSGSSPRLLMELTRLTQGTRFFEMVPGKLSQMAELIEKLVKRV